MADAAETPMVTLNIEPPFGSPFRVVIPADWNQVQMDEEKIDFSASRDFLPLGIYMPPASEGMFVVAARPKFATGTLAQWLEQACAEQKVTIEQTGETTLGSAPVAICMGTQKSGKTQVRIYIAMFEDGGLLYSLMAACPVKQWESLAETFEKVVLAFRLLDPKGSTMPAPGNDAPEKQSGKKAKAAPPEPPPEEREATFADFALADGPESLAPDNEANRLDPSNPKDGVPSIYDVDNEGKCALMNFAPLDGLVTVPFGWNVNSDGTVVKVFSLENGLIVEFSWLEVAKDLDAAFQAELDAALKKHPKAEHCRLELGPETALALRNMRWKNRPFEQVIILKDIPTRESGLLKIAASAAPDDMGKLLGLVELMVNDMRIV